MTIEQTKWHQSAKAERNKQGNWPDRLNIERSECWREINGVMPFLNFPKQWGIKIIPPFGGALARFVVKKGSASVSVYADFYEALGCSEVPHWEIYPDATGDNARFSIEAETKEMLKAIGKSLAKQNRDKA